LCEVAAHPVTNVVDTTGAGDMWAAGFLYGIGTGRELKESAGYGAALGAMVVEHQGTTIPEEKWQNVTSQLRSGLHTRR